MKRYWMLTWAICLYIPLLSQQTGIGVSAPHPSAQLEVASANGGLLPPRVALRSVNDITTVPNPAAGLLVYNTATAGNAPTNVLPGYYYYTGSSWLRLGGPGQQSGDMQYWNGSQWVLVPAGSNGEELSFCNGQLVWGPCPGGNGLATVRIDSIRRVRGSSANIYFNVPVSGGTTIRERGVAYSQLPGPVPSRIDSTLTDSGQTGVAVIPLAYLQDQTTYYARAYAINGFDTSYSADSAFTTPPVIAPAVSTTPPFGVGSTTAWTGGIVSRDGGADLIIKGVIYDRFSNVDGSDPGVYSTDPAIGEYYSYLTGLLPNTTYYVQATASNGLTNTSRGAELSFTTLPAGHFAAIYFCDIVRQQTGTTDPGPVPAITGLTFSPLKVTGAGAPGFQSRLDSVFSFSGWGLGAVNGSDLFPPHVDTLTRYFEFTVTPLPGRSLQLTQLKFRWQRSANGVRRTFVRSSADAYASNLPASVSPLNSNISLPGANRFQISDNVSTPQHGCTITLSGPAYSNLTTPVTFRIYGMFAEEPAGTFGIDNVVLNGIVN